MGLIEAKARGAQVLTFGCRLNAFESDVIRAEADAAGLRDAVVVNTCAVTGEAVRQARQAIRKARRENPHARIIVTGCAAETETARFMDMPEIDLVLGNREKLTRDAYARLSGERTRVAGIMTARDFGAAAALRQQGRARAYLAVQNGCDHRCTFCIIPYGRGPSRSLPAGAAVDAVKRLVDDGAGEVVLTGVDLTAYGRDLPGAPALGRLVQQILKHVPDLKRLRLSSIDSVEADAALLDAIASEPRLMPHLHLSLQAGDDMVLKRMKRRHSRTDAIAFCETMRAKRPDIAFGADLIAGFPTETDAMAENTLKLVDECGLSYLHVFPFSPRDGTPAARMPQVPGAVVKARAKALREKGEAALKRHLDARIGRDISVIVEEPGLARAADFTLVAVANALRPGAILTLRATAHDGTKLIANAA